ncbi:MAG: response regulator [Puniceicoccales bacterium]|nr:response regulator [Puniceicoccales bacterium]
MSPLSVLQILCIEKTGVETQRVVDELRLSGYAAEITKATTEEELRKLIAQEGWSAVIADFHAPRLGGLTGLKIVREADHDVPFILVCDMAARELEDALRHGANDYILYTNIARIGSIIRRELNARAMRAERILTEDKLRKSTKQLDISFSLLAASVEAMLEGVAIHDASGRVIISNKRFLELAGLEGENIKGAKWDDFAAKFRNRLKDSTPWDALMAKPKEEMSPYFIVERDDFQLEVCATPCLNGKEYAGRIWRLRDVTERERNLEMRHRLEQKLSQSQKMEALGVLAGGMAHDFNNFLAVILNNAELMRASIASEGKVKHNMDNLLEALEHASILVRQVLQFSHRDRHQEFREISLNEVLPRIVDHVRNEMSQEVEISYHASQDIPPIMGDIDQIQQMVKNLCLNSTQAVREGLVKIDIELTGRVVTEQDVEQDPDIKAGAYAVLSISDNGPGMAPETLARIFEPFFTTKPVGMGSGLGLPVVHGLVRAHGGVILASSSCGGGATFRIYFPALIQTHVSVPLPTKERLSKRVATEESPEKSWSGAKIMVVDDDEAIASVTSEILGMLGFQPITFTEPAKALEAFQNDPNMADLMLADVNMPNIDGVMLSREMLECRPGFPILLLSGYSGRWTVDAVRMIGVIDMLSKPISAQAMGKAIRKALTETATAKK